MHVQKHQTNSQSTEPLVTGNNNGLAASSSLPEKAPIPLILRNQEHKTYKDNPQFDLIF